MKVLLIAGALIASPAVARSEWSLADALGTPDALKLEGSVRLRYETIDGQPRPGFSTSDDLVSIRTTLLAEYAHDGVRIGAELFDSRAYDSGPRTPLSTGEVNALELVQAYASVDLTEPLGSGSSGRVQAGRFTLNLGSRRLVAADEYRNTTNGYTGVRADLAGGGVKATFIYTLPQMRRPDDFPSLRDNRIAVDRESFDLVLWGGLINKAAMFGKTAAELSYFHLGERDLPGRPTRNRSLETISVRAIRDPRAGGIDYEGEAIYQFGTIRSGLAPGAPALDVSAWFAHADIGYTVRSGWKPRVSIEFDYASGDRGGGSYNRFDTLFGMRRADLAPAGLYNAIGRANILAPGLRIEAAPDRRFDILATYRPMWLASRTDSFSTTAVRDASGRSGRFAGHQIDARVRYWLIAETLRFEADAVLLFKGRFLRTAPNAPRDGDTRYLSFNLTALF